MPEGTIEVSRKVEIKVGDTTYYITPDDMESLASAVNRIYQKGYADGIQCQKRSVASMTGASPPQSQAELPPPPAFEQPKDAHF